MIEVYINRAIIKCQGNVSITILLKKKKPINNLK